MPTPEVSPEVRALQHEFALLREQIREEFLDIAERLKALETSKLELSGGLRHRPPAPEDTKNTEKKEKLEDDLELQLGSEVDLGTQVGPVHFGESAWTFPVMLGLTSASALEVVFAVLLLLINLGMQVMFAEVILGPSFMGSPFEEEVDTARRWRAGIAHDYKYMDLQQTSLATRVCSADGALILSTATLVNHINAFMGLSTGDFVPGTYQPGILLCVLCILLWSLCVYKEFRNILLSVEAILTVPLTPTTVYRDNTLHSLSSTRQKVLLVTFFTRTVIASVLLIAGIRWLARTTSITDLMLNAVALNAILDVDEWLFAGFSPISIELSVKQLNPITVSYSQRRSQAEAVGLLALLLTTLLIPYVVLLQPLGQTMSDVKWEMCAGNQNFVVVQNAETQVITGMDTKNYSAADISVIERAVQRQIHSAREEVSYYISFQPGQQQFELQKNHDMHSDQEQWTACVETDYLQPGGYLYGDPLMGTLVPPRLHTALAMLGDFREVGNCTEVQHLCDLPQARLLRMVCGATCGCTDPLSQPFHKVIRGGCTESCLKLNEPLLGQVACKDQVPGEGESSDGWQARWKSFWDIYPDALSDFFGNDMSQTVIYSNIKNLVAEMKVRGCPGLSDPTLQFEITSSAKWCEGFEPLFRPLAYICPESCGCHSSSMALPNHCPSPCGNVTA
eukprot:s538_g12.t1